MPRPRNTAAQRPGRPQRRRFLLPAIPVEAEQFNPQSPPQNVWKEGEKWVIDTGRGTQEIEAGDWIIDLPDDTQQVWRSEDWIAATPTPRPL